MKQRNNKEENPVQSKKKIVLGQNLEVYPYYESNKQNMSLLNMNIRSAKIKTKFGRKPKTTDSRDIIAKLMCLI